MTPRVLVLLPVFALLASADGGKLQFQRKAGVFDIALFATPAPVRTGRTDFSVMVQTTSQTPVLDATVRLHFVKRDATSIAEVSAPARREQATNKLLYASQVDLPSPGLWRVEVSVQNAKDSALITGQLKVLGPRPPLLAHWPYFVFIPLVILLFIVNQRLKRKRRSANRR